MYDVLFTLKVAGKVEPVDARSTPNPQPLIAICRVDSAGTIIDTDAPGVLPTTTTCPCTVLKFALRVSARVPFLQAGSVCVGKAE